MEIKATLQQPYNDKQKMDFIVEQNHKNGYEIKYDELQNIEAWGYTEEEIQEQQKQELINQLVQQLDEIDLKTVRPLRAIQSGQGTQEDQQKLDELEAQAKEIRRQIQELKNVNDSENMEETNA